MRRWNGWGEENISYPLSTSALAFLNQSLGIGDTSADISFEDVLNSIPESRCPDHPLIQKDPVARLFHARGQSLPDWIALRSNMIAVFPDGVAFPADETQIDQLFRLARERELTLIPYGGGTSVVGHINPQPGDKPIVTVDLKKFSRLVNLDEDSQIAEIQAGVTGPALESQLERYGFTLGHYPQSFEYSTLGGWIATRSSGQQSRYYGRVEDYFLGGRVITPIGRLEIAPHSASASGPDLRHLILGSEGRIGIITQASIKVRRIPEKDRYYGFYFHDWSHALEAVRKIAQSDLSISMIRLSDPLETEIIHLLSGKDKLLSMAKAGFRLLGFDHEKCLLILGVTGNKQDTKYALSQARHIIREHHGLFTGAVIGNIWKRSRFRTPYLRNNLWEAGYMLDTLETEIRWSRVSIARDKIIRSIHASGETFNERILVFSHLSHLYRTGASIYLTYLLRRTQDAEENLHRWKTIKSAASMAVLDSGGTISHQHGVGRDHRAYLPIEKGEVCLKALQQIIEIFDPDSTLNPGILVSNQPGGN